MNYPTQQHQKKAEIAVFDAQIDDLSTLLNGLKPGIEAFVLHPKEDGLAQISSILASRKDIRTLHLISHGAPGQLFMGRSPITAQDLTAKALGQWQQSLSSDAEILIYGCNVAIGTDGLAFVRKLHRLTGANIAASSTPTGNTALGGNWNLDITSSEFTPTVAFAAASITAYAGILEELISGLGGAAGFGENTLTANDDRSTPAIDITPVFSDGLDFFGTTYTSLFLNNNGNITFASPQSTFTPAVITGTTGNPIIAAYFADVDTAGGSAPATPGGTSTGTNLVYWDLDTVNGVATFTWDDVGYFNDATNRLNAFQIRLIDQDDGDFDIEFRYEDINWTTGDSSGGSDGLGGTVARAGWSSGNGTDFFELNQSGDQGQMLDLENAVNTNGAGVINTQEGIFRWSVLNGEVVSGIVFSITSLSLSEPSNIVEGDNLSTAPNSESFTVALDRQPTSDVVLNLSSSDIGEATLSTATLAFTPGNWDQPQTVTVQAIADQMFDPTQEITITISVDDVNSDGLFANVRDQTIAVAVEHVGPTSSRDRLVYGPGRDRVFAMVGNDRINGGPGNDRLSGQGGRDRLFGDTGNDDLIGLGGADSLFGGVGDDRALGGPGNDRIAGNAGNENLVGGNGADDLLGGVGNDTLIGGANDDRLLGAFGDDLMRGNLGNDTLNGGAGADRQLGGAGNDRLNGQGANDVLRGGVGDDTLRGGAGNDRLQGEGGNDVIVTGAGSDRIVIRRDQGFDRVIDFTDGEDLIALGGIQFRQLTFQQRGDNVRVLLDNEALLLLRNLTVGQLSSADFV